MKTFFSTLLLTAVAAQNNTTSTNTTTSITNSISDAWNSVTNWFASKTQQYLTTQTKVKAFAAYNSTNTTGQGLNSYISLEQSAIGVNFVSVGLDVSGAYNAKEWANGTYSLVYFQIAQPVASARLLQSANTTTWYEGWAGVLAGGKPSGSVAYTFNYNLWGSADLRNDNTHFTKFGSGSGSSLVTNTTSPWQLSNASQQTWTVGNSTTPSVWHAQVWRLASLGDSLRFKFVHSKTYTGHAGHRFWLAGSTAATLANESGNSANVSFMFDSATTLTSLAVAATGLLVTMF